MLTCPRCHTGLTGEEVDCPRCGVVLAKAAKVVTAVVKKPSEIIVTTGDLRQEYRVIEPVYAYVTDQDGMLTKVAKELGVSEPTDAGLARAFSDILLFGAANVTHARFPTAFRVCVALLRRACIKLDGDAVIWLRQDVDISSALTGNKNLFMQVYGTAVRFS